MDATKLIRTYPGRNTETKASTSLTVTFYSDFEAVALEDLNGGWNDVLARLNRIHELTGESISAIISFNSQPVFEVTRLGVAVIEYDELPH